MSRQVTTAAFVVVLLLLAGCAQTTGSPTAASSVKAPGMAARTTSVSTVTASPNLAITRRKVRRVLATVPVLPGARSVPHPPSASLAKPAQTIGSPNVVMSTRWWRAPGTVPAALRYLRAHPPAHLRPTGHGTFTSPRVVVKSLILDGRDTSAYRQLTLVIAVSRYRRGVAVRADAEAVWLPLRTVAEHVNTATLTSVDVTVTRPEAARTVHRTLTAQRARALARGVNRLPVGTPGTYSCPADLGYVDSLVFHVRGPDVVLRADTTGCATVQVTVSGRRQPSLQGGSVLDHAVVKALGLPAAYVR